MSSSSSTSSSGTVSNGRYWGLASGLNVDSIVSGLISGEQSKIDKAQQSEQKLEWKQTAYRDIITKMDDFQNAYLQLGDSTSMATSDMYSSYSTSSSDSTLLTTTANSDAAGKTQTVTVLQSATTAALASNSAIKGGGITGNQTWADALTALKGTTGDQTLSFTVDDVTKSITLSSTEIQDLTSTNGTNSTDKTGLKNLIDDKLKTAFGTTTAGTAKVSTNATTSGDFGFVTDDSYNISLSIASSSSNTALLGTASAQTSHLDTSTTLASLLNIPSTTTGDIIVNINGKNVTLGTKDTSIADALSAINNAGVGVTAAYDSTSDKVSLTTSQSGSSGTISVDCDSDTYGFFDALKLTATTDTGAVSATGKDAEISINDGTTTTKYSRSTNNFTIGGVTYNINESVSSGSPKTSTVSFAQNSSSLKTGINNFISAYNTLLDAIHTQTDTVPDSDYAPLTDSQKASMTSTQIDSWNAKASQGTLNNDSTLQSICDSMRSLLYKSVTMSDGSSYSLYNMGVTTSDDSSSYGKLEVKSEDSTKFANAIATNASKIKQLFTKSSDTLLNISPKTTADYDKQTARKSDEGLVDRLNDTIKAATGNIYGTYGSLLQIAGTTTTNTYKNTIYDQLTEIKSNITDLKTEMTTKKNHLYTEFQNLETYMNQANSQSSMISSMSSSS